MVDGLKPIPLRFYSTLAGREPVREWLNGLEADDKRIVVYDISKVQFGWPLGLPLCRSLKDGLWEVRSTISGPREVRVVFAFHQGVLFALNAFFKSTQKTPQHEIDLASQRLEEIKRYE